MAKKIQQVNKAKSDRKMLRSLIAIPVLALFVKIIIICNIEAGSWLGADGENYVTGVIGLIKDGFFSSEPKLSFWPAGYPILMWPIAAINTAHFFYVVSILQSVFFGYSTFFATREISKASIRNFAVPASLIITLNPTLSLNSLSIGYEAPVAASLLMALGFSIRILNSSNEDQKEKVISGIFLSAWFALAIFMQPRFLLAGFAVVLVVAMKTSGKTFKLKFLSLSLIILIIAPAVMIVRNNQAINNPTISTNLGVTMAIGAGPSTSGSYVHEGPEVPCSAKPGADVVSDSQRVKCVIDWYLKNPLRTAKLAFNKSMYFWSPWTGPLANGTMARNPWLKISPAYTSTKNKDGSDLILGPFGRLISYLWIIGQVLFLLLGFFALRRRGEFEKIIAWLLISPVLISWMISIGTIGDHRFRVPTMSLSLILQVIGMLAISKRISKAT